MSEIKIKPRFIKTPIDFSKSIIATQYLQQAKVLRKWENKFAEDCFESLPQPSVFLELIQELEKKTFIFKTINYIKSCYQIDQNDHDNQVKYTNDEIENFIIEEFIYDHQIKVDDEEMKFFLKIFPEANQTNVHYFLSCKKLYDFLLKNFKFEFDYGELIEYLEQRKSYQKSINVNLLQWKRLDKWLQKYNLNFLNQQFSQNFFDYCWKKNQTNFLTNDYFKKFIDQSNFTQKQQEEIESIVPKCLNLNDKQFWLPYKNQFQKNLTIALKNTPNQPISKIIIDVMHEIIENYLVPNIYESTFGWKLKSDHSLNHKNY
ncbi:hypothetical protein MCAV_02570 [[Mycoplasma] cavipharyngis]|uniref:hypothetical protein n=1 Tax=[Mycoplasma] cavipharyngis TaxID=92757 RepID=UPI003704C0DF